MAHDVVIGDVIDYVIDNIIDIIDYVIDDDIDNVLLIMIFDKFLI